MAAKNGSDVLLLQGEDMQVAGWDTAQGYLGMQFAGVGRDFPVIQDIIKMYQADNQEVGRRVGQKMVRVINEYAQQAGYELILDPAAAQLPGRSDRSAPH